MDRLAATNRCQLFEYIANKVWNKVISNHAAKIDVPEIGITKDIITDIRMHYTGILNFGVWSNPGYNESLNGSDIDIFVETTTGNFIWYALQAKVLHLNGKYRDLDRIRGGEYQWDKLNRLAETAGCISQYLLYNGVKNFTYSGLDKCNRAFNETQFGCSLVETNDIKKISSLNSSPAFLDFQPKHAQPWRVIVCCKHDNHKQTLYNISQIKKAVEHYPLVEGNKDILKRDNIEQQTNSNVNAINNFSENISRTPYCRIVIRTTNSLHQSK